MAKEESLPKPEPDKQGQDDVFLPPGKLSDGSICPDQKPEIKPFKRVKITIPTDEEDEKLGRFSELAEQEQFQGFEDELKELDAAYERGDLKNLFDGTVLMNEDSTAEDTIKISRLFSMLDQAKLIEMGLVLKNRNGEVLEKSFLRGLPDQYGETIEDNHGKTVPTAGLKITGASKLKI